jgi:XTP/dITP diphosphohydrolase
MTELLLASNNDHKHAEFVRLFPGVRIVRPREIGVSFDFAEDGASFLANALGKAQALHGIAHRPVIGDDSGLCVAALGGEPGVRSSRYGSDGMRKLETPERNALLLSRLAGAADRRAFFVCCLVLAIDGERFIAVQETVHGEIADSPRGTNGFGYDPLFLLSDRGLTIAELPDAEKDLVSHRGRAARRLRVMMNGMT